MKLTKRMLALLLSLTLMLGAVAGGGLRASADEGIAFNETESRYEISSYAGLKAFADIVNGGATGACAVLTQDITAEGADWTPIGSFQKQFNGTFDGDRHTITGLSTESNANRDYIGLFGYVNFDGVVKNVGLLGGFMKGKDCVSAVAGFNNGWIENCYNTGTVQATDFGADVGGVVGWNEQGTIRNCYNMGTVLATDTGANVGGVVGYNSTIASGRAAIINCYNTGEVSGETVGGIAGYNDGDYKGNATIANCFNTGRIVGASLAGGVAGRSYAEENSSTTITDCYNLGAVSDSDDFAEIGGIVGGNNNSDMNNANMATVTNCYNAGAVTATCSYTLVGGVAGSNDGVVQNCYYDRNVCSADDDFGTALTTAQMTAGTYSDQTVTNMPGFSSENWLVRQADEFYFYYPHLKGFDLDASGVQLPAESIRKADWPARKMKDDVMEISNYDELKAFSQRVNGGYTRLKGILTADIEALVVDPIADGMAQDKRWTPIGDGEDDHDSYAGVFDGDGHTVSGLCNESVSEAPVAAGLFGWIKKGGVVKNVHMTDVNLKAGSFLGAVAGYSAGSIINCSNTGDITGNANNSIGGIVGRSCGMNSTATVSNCYNTGDVTGLSKTRYVGGIAGSLYAKDGTATISNCFNTGDVAGENDFLYVGGITGYSPGSSDYTLEISNCYNMGDVKGTGLNSMAGGIAGNIDVAKLTNCYSAGAVTGDDGIKKIGGVTGYRYSAPVKNCYFDKTVCNKVTDAIHGVANTDNVKGLTTDQMIGTDALTQMQFADASVWLVKENTEYYWFYPHLKGFNLDADGSQLEATAIDPTDWPAKIEKKNDPNLSLSAPAVTYGEDLVITATLADGVTGDVAFTVNGTGYSAPIENGTATLTLTNPPAGDYAVQADFPGNAAYGSASAQTSVTVSKITPAISVSATDAFIGSKTKITVTYPAEISQNETPESGTGFVTIYMNGMDMGVFTGENGVIEQYYNLADGFSAGTQTVRAKFNGSQNYAAVNAETTFEVTATALASTLTTGDTFEMGMYPQTEVTDSDTIYALEQIWCPMTNYGYIKNSTETVDMSYADIAYNGEVYRKVRINEYRPFATNQSSSNNNQETNGYSTGMSGWGETYYFKWEPITWQVLAKESDGVYVMSKSLLDAQAYNNNYEDTTWETSSLRSWLNDGFYNAAFSAAEQANIVSITHSNEGSPSNGSVSGGNDTTDRLWVLSYSDAINSDYGFNPDDQMRDEARRAQGTDYAKSQGILVSSSTGNSNWWLRCPGLNTHCASGVFSHGAAELNDGVYTIENGIRPAFKLDLNATVGTSDPKALIEDPNLTMENQETVYGETITLTASLAQNAAGTVDFTVTKDAFTATYSANIENGTATVTLPVLDAGTYSVTADYAGQGNFDAATASATLTVNQKAVNVRVTGPDGPYMQYNGQEQTHTGAVVWIYDREETGLDDAKLRYTGNTTAKGTNAGRHETALSADDCVCDDGNYNVTFTAEGSIYFTINQSVLNIKADSKETNHGDDLVALTYTIEPRFGSYYNESDLGISISTNADKNKPDAYDIIITTQENPNYLINITNGTYTVGNSPHTWGGVTYTWDGTASVKAERKCVYCEETETETKATTAQQTKAPSCTTPGETTYTATFDNPAFEKQEKKVNDIPATGSHNYSVVKEIVDPTCTADGYTIYQCAGCDAEITKDIVPALGHDDGLWQVDFEATPEHDGQKSCRCSRCGELLETETFAQHTHETGFERVLTPATCTEDGEKGLYCEHCNALYDVETIPATGHDDGVWKVDFEATADHDGQKTLYCTKCGAVLDQETFPAHDHTLGYEVTLTPATCTQPGEKGKVCADCGAVYETEVIPPTGHVDGAERILHPATCTTDGQKATLCEACGKIIKVEAIPATGHTAGTERVLTPATCTEAGETGVYCATCGDLMEVKPIEATGHDEGVWKVDFDATADHDGQRTRYCTKCGAALETETFTMHTHTFGYEVVSLEATCTKDGEKGHVCSICGAVYETEVIPAAGHTEGYQRIVTPATCTEPGVMGTFCAICDQRYAVTEIPATGHSFDAWTPNGDGTHARVCGSCSFKETANCKYTKTVTEPTCTEEGYTTYVCDDCGFTYKDNFVDPLGHDWSDWSDDENGETHSHTCGRCGDTETEVHNFGEWVYNKDAKFFKNGTKTRTCGDCDCTETEEAANTSIFARIFLTPILWVLSLIRKTVFTGSFLWYLPWLNIFPKM